MEGLAGANAVDEVEFVDYSFALGLWEEKGLVERAMEWTEFVNL